MGLRKIFASLLIGVILVVVNALDLNASEGIDSWKASFNCARSIKDQETHPDYVVVPEADGSPKSSNPGINT